MLLSGRLKIITDFPKDLKIHSHWILNFILRPAYKIKQFFLKEGLGILNYFFCSSWDLKVCFKLRLQNHLLIMCVCFLKAGGGLKLNQCWFKE
jgi:hypothetical protein